jgi:hypothetical protein
MSEGICNLRFAICDLRPSSDGISLRAIALLFSGVREAFRARNRFSLSGFKGFRQTAEGVNSARETGITLLKQVNERGGFGNWISRETLCRTTGVGLANSSGLVKPQIANRKSKIP